MRCPYWLTDLMRIFSYVDIHFEGEWQKDGKRDESRMRRDRESRQRVGGGVEGKRRDRKREEVRREGRGEEKEREGSKKGRTEREGRRRGGREGNRRYLK